MSTPQHEKLKVFIGKWHTTGQVAASASASASRVDFTDIYTWYPGGFFVLHNAEGTVGGEQGASLEILGYDAASNLYTATFFDSAGACGKEDLQVAGNTWTWRGSDVMGVKEHRCTAVVSEDGLTIQARHEKSEDGINWELWMDVTLKKQD